MPVALCSAHTSSGSNLVHYPKLALALLTLMACPLHLSAQMGRSETASVVVVSPEAAPEEERMKVLDPEGTLSEAELTQRVRFLSYTGGAAPRVGNQTAAAAGSAFNRAFQAISGGASGSQDLARIRSDLPR